MWDFMNIKVFTDNNQMAFDWLLPHGENVMSINKKY